MAYDIYSKAGTDEAISSALADSLPDLTGYVQNTDTRLGDARTPTAHAASHKTAGADALTAADIGAQPAGSYAAASHTHAPADIGAQPAGSYAAASHTHAPADIGAATAAQGALADATTVEQVTLNANLDYTLPAGVPANTVHRAAITQDGTGGYTVTYGGAPVTVDTSAGASTLVEFWPGGKVTYPGASAPSGGGCASELTPVTSNTTSPAGTQAGQLVGYLNTAAAAITVNEQSLAAGAWVLFGWSGSAWVQMNTGSLIPAATPVTATAPTFNDASGTASDTFTIPTKAGVEYLVGGTVTAAGTYPGAGTVTITAQATSGYTLTGTSSWSHAFSTATDPIPVTPTGPTWTDDTVSGGGTWTTPTQTGVTYSPASGTATPGQSVTVTATAQSGYTLSGTTSWQHTFPAAQDGGLPAGAFAIFDARDMASVGAGNPVTSWPARSGAVPALTPTGDGATYGTRGTQHYVRTGTNTYLESTLSAPLPQPTTCMIVATVETANAAMDCPLLASSNKIHAIFHNTEGFGANAGAPIQAPGHRLTVGESFLLWGVFDGGSTAYGLGAGQLLAGNAGTNPRSSIKLGANTANSVKVDIAVAWVGIWPRKLATSEIGDVRSWLITEGVLSA